MERKDNVFLLKCMYNNFRFQLKWWQVQTDIRNATELFIDTIDDNAIIHGLQTRTVYQLRVQGVSAGGDGQMSVPVYFTLKGISIDERFSSFFFKLV